jgi:hypothetical protein
MSTSKWYARGKEGLDKTKKINEENKRRKENKGAGRFFLKAGEEATIIFLDSNPFFCYVHQFKVGKSWNNFATCIKEVAPCPLCDAELYPTWTAHYTVIDTRSFEYNGKTYKNIKKLFPAKGEVIQILADLQAKYKDLRGRAFKVKRYGEKEINTGTHFEYLGKVKDLSKYGEDTNPIEYEKVLAPPTNEQYEEWGFEPIEELGSESLETNDEVLEDEILDEGDIIQDDEEDLDNVEEIEEKKPVRKILGKKKKTKPASKKSKVEDEDDETLEDFLDDLEDEEEDNPL